MRVRRLDEPRSPGLAGPPAATPPFVLWVPPGYTFCELRADTASRWGLCSSSAKGSAPRLQPVGANGEPWPDDARVLNTLSTYTVVGAAETSSKQSIESLPCVRIRVRSSRGARTVVDQCQEEVASPAQAAVQTPAAASSTPKKQNDIPDHVLGKAAELWSIFVYYAVKSSGDDLELKSARSRSFVTTVG